MMIDYILKNLIDGKAIIVSGATGFLGSAIINELLKYKQSGCNVNIIAYARSKQKARSLFKTTEIEYIQELTPLIRADYFVHAAGVTKEELLQSSPFDSYIDNERIDKEVLIYSLSSAIKRICYISSAIVYGDYLYGGKVEENKGYNYGGKETVYYRIKNNGEGLCNLFAKQYGLDVCVIRPFSVYGPGMNLDQRGFACDLLKQARENKTMIIKESGRDIRNFGFISDVATAVLYVLLLGKDNIYNVGSETENYSIIEFANKVNEIIFDGNLEIVVNKPNGEPTTSIPNLTNLRALGWKSYVSLDQGIQYIKNSWNSVE